MKIETGDLNDDRTLVLNLTDTVSVRFYAGLHGIRIGLVPWGDWDDVTPDQARELAARLTELAEEQEDRSQFRYYRSAAGTLLYRVDQDGKLYRWTWDSSGTSRRWGPSAYSTLETIQGIYERGGLPSLLKITKKEAKALRKIL